MIRRFSVIINKDWVRDITKNIRLNFDNTDKKEDVIFILRGIKKD